MQAALLGKLKLIANSNEEGCNQYKPCSGSSNVPPMPEHEHLTPERNPGMQKLWAHLQQAQTPSEAARISKKYEDAALLPAGHADKVSDGAREMLKKARQEKLRSMNSTQRPASEGRVDRILRIRDSSGRARGRK